MWTWEDFFFYCCCCLGSVLNLIFISIILTDGVGIFGFFFCVGYNFILFRAIAIKCLKKFTFRRHCELNTCRSFCLLNFILKEIFFALSMRNINFYMLMVDKCVITRCKQLVKRIFQPSACKTLYASVGIISLSLPLEDKQVYPQMRNVLFLPFCDP